MTFAKLLLAGAAMVLAPAAPAWADSPPAEAKPAAAHFGSWGVDLSTRDLSVKPGDDFQRYASGKWLDKTVIPADRASTGTFADLREEVQDQVQNLIKDAPAGAKFGALYASFMDERAVEQRGLKPLMADLAKLRAIQTKAAFARYMGTTGGSFGAGVVGIGVIPDTANPTTNVLYVGQAGLGMPSRDYYFDAQFAPQRAAYKAYMVRTLKRLGHADPKAASAVYALEEAIAKVSWKSDESRDIQKINNGYSSAQLSAYAPGLDWKAFFAGAGIADQARMIVAENTAVKKIAAIYARTPLATLKLWEEFQIADQASPYLGKAMVDSRFAYTKTLSGVSEIRPRWKRAIDLVNGSLGEMVGEAYVARYFPASSKAKMEQLVANLKEAMAAAAADPKNVGKRFRPVDTPAGVIILKSPSVAQWSMTMAIMWDDDKSIASKAMRGLVPSLVVYPGPDEVKKITSEWSGIWDNKDLGKAVRVLAGVECDAHAK
jgi:putative endopeptidase